MDTLGEMIEDGDVKNLTEEKNETTESTLPPPRVSQGRGFGVAVDGRLWWAGLLAVTFLALLTRQVSLDQPGGTLWDEVHFGTFANHYLDGRFYHDVHPPLGKMLIAGAAWLSGYNGSFEFKVSKMYPPEVNYVAMRSMMAVFGASLVPLSYLVVWELTASFTASLLAALCILSDTFLHRLTTLIVLDPPLLVTILAAVFGTLKFHNQRHREWSLAWWGWLFFTALCLGTVMSIKYVGVFTVVTVALHNAYQILLIAFDPRRPLWVVLPHTVVRAVVFLVVAAAVYLTSFVIHFLILTKASMNGGGFYHTRFFAAFDNTEYENATFPAQVHYGANITLQNSRPLCGYLESWFDLFPSAWTAPCQQVTAATIRDDEFLTWIIKKVDLEAGSVYDGGDASQPPMLVRSGDYVMLTHVATGRSLRSHGHRAPITKRQYQVCGYGDDGAGGHFETWQLLVPGAEDGTPLGVINQDFMLRHYKMNCYLRSNEMVKLPHEWAFNGAKEVTCAKNKKDTGLLWHVNWNSSPKLGGGVPAQSLAVGLWGKIFHQHLNMFIGNSVLISSNTDEERHAQPWMWPLLWQVQTMGSYLVNETSGEENFAVGMSNPYVAYLNLASLTSVLLLTLAHGYYRKRCSTQHLGNVEHRQQVLTACWWLVLCWGTHYLPFFFMSRVLYYHHYCPSYIFSCMITGVLLSWGCETVAGLWQGKRKGVEVALLLLCTASLLTSYLFLFPLATFVHGTQFEYNARLNPVLDYFHMGQLWPEFGYRMSEYITVSSTMVGKWNESNFDNPDINATLYFITTLNTTSEEHPVISPVPASSFALWSPEVTH